MRLFRLAISPVWATIILVAITIALAALLFYLLSVA